MAKSVEFFFDFGSPAAYLAFTQIRKIAERTGAELVWRPFLLGAVMQAAGNRSPIECAAKGKWMIGDLARFAKRYGVEFNMNPHFPINTLPLMRGAIVAQEDGVIDRYAEAIYQAIWVDGKNMADPPTIGAVLTAADLDAAHFMDAIQSQKVKDKLKANTEEAVERGAFGAPTYFVDGEMHFGQDRLNFVEEALAA
ncbi:MAG: 2-hydroxychromene-2-carboxylate isomerase [Rhodospirillales bacterium]|nr:2-hydroxychromene-2-carboxylate isomerase [Rhodospirillales bacterium]